ncbi:MAG: hypothetical protein HY923_11455 [Elusimicrobia bacterium]|nr:hypothetical protein [Elusimicrobiota bacterium]
MSGLKLLPVLLFAVGGVNAASTGGSPASLRARVAAELNAANPWRAARLADEWAGSNGISADERAEALIQGALAHAQVGDYAGAEAALQEALKAKPGQPDASYLLAEAMRDRPEQALPHGLNAAASGTPRGRSAAYRLRAEIRLDLGDRAGALADLARAPDDLEALALTASLSRDAKDARRVCDAAGAQPAWRRAAAERVCARALYDLKDYSGAMAALGNALSLDADDADTLRGILRVKRTSPFESAPGAAVPLPDKTMTVEQARAALAADGEDLEALRVLIASEKNMASAVKLAERFTAAVRRSPNWQRVDAYRLSAAQWIALKDKKKALGSLERAEDLSATSVATEKLVGKALGKFIGGALSEAYEAAMKVRLELGDEAGAEATLERGLQLAPANIQLLRLMISRKLAASKPREALPYAERFAAAAAKATPSAMWNPEKQGLLPNGAVEKRNDIMEAQQTLENVRRAAAAATN